MARRSNIKQRSFREVFGPAPKAPRKPKPAPQPRKR